MSNKDLIEKTKTLEDVEISIKDLKERMIKSIAVLNAGLSQQAVDDFSRIPKQKEILDKLESIIFSDEYIYNLDPQDQMELYKIAAKDRNDLRKFMLDLNKNASHSAEALSNIENIQSSLGNSDTGQVKKDNAETAEIISHIKELIAKKATKKSKK